MSIPAGVATHIPAEPWSGRHDGSGTEHARWWSTVNAAGTGPVVNLVGFASDEGVRRNHGRVGAFDGPRAIRNALGSLAFHHSCGVKDLGDIVVSGHDLEGGHTLLGQVAGEALTAGFTVVLGGGHETAYGTFLALRNAGYPHQNRKLAVINLDAHFDLRTAEIPTSGTPFKQMSDELGTDFHYAVAGISAPNNTKILFDEAERIGARWLSDEDCPAQLISFLTEVLQDADDVYLTIDLDVLPAPVAPGVSAPAALGVSMEIIHNAVRHIAASGKLRIMDVVELNPSLDIDNRTAKVAARLIDTAVAQLY